MEINERQSNVQRHRINWLDIGIVIVLIALAIFLILNYFPSGSSNHTLSDKKVTIEYTVRIDKLPSDLTLSLESGNAIVDIDTKASLGTLAANAMISPYQENVYNEQSGGIEAVNSDKYVTAYVTVIAEATENDYGFYIDNTRIAVEADLNLRIKGLEACGRCIGIEIKSEG